MSEVKTNSHGTNVAIKYHVLPDESMRKLGFWDGHNHEFAYWFRGVCVEKLESQYTKQDLKRVKKNQNYKPRYSDISFDVTIPKDGVSDIDINTIDDDFGQPYDWQWLTAQHGDKAPEAALACKMFVEKQMKLLQDAGVLEGHVYGEYI